jgi:hypothetical protein
MVRHRFGPLRRLLLVFVVCGRLGKGQQRQTKADNKQPPPAMPRRGSLAPPRLALWLLLALLLAAAAEVRARVQLPSQQLASTRAATAAKPVLGDAADAALENAKDDALQDNYNSLTFAGEFGHPASRRRRRSAS